MPLAEGPSSTGMHPFNAALFEAPFGTTDPTSITDLIGRYTEIAQIKSLNGFEIKPGTTDVTNLRSPLRAKEKIPGWVDPGQINYSLLYSQAAYFAIQTLLPDGTDTAPSWGRRVFALVCPDEGVFVCTGFFAGQPVKCEDGDTPVTVDGVIELSGLPRFYEYDD